MVFTTWYFQYFSLTADLVRPLLCRECRKNDYFSISILKYWSQEFEDELATILKNMLTKSHSTPNKKRHK